MSLRSGGLKMVRKMKDNTVKNLWIGLFFLFSIVSVWTYFEFREKERLSIEYKTTQKELQKELDMNAKCNHHVDSLQDINDRLSHYESLTMAMLHRDEATKRLKNVGDIVYLKIDSSRVVIEDIIIGGGKYNYFIKYRVLLKDESKREITPEMIY
jgi:hypothetical protein